MKTILKLVILIIVLELLFSLKPLWKDEQIVQVPSKVAVEAQIPVKTAPKAVKKVKVAHYVKPEVSYETKTYIDNIFGEKSEIALAVLTHESGLRLDAINYNCRYAGKSRTCKTIADRKNAWSVDCGIGQTNIKGKVCPAKLLTLKGNMEQVAKIYRTQGLRAWVSYTSGAYKRFL